MLKKFQFNKMHLTKSEIRNLDYQIWKSEVGFPNLEIQICPSNCGNPNWDFQIWISKVGFQIWKTPFYSETDDFVLRCKVN